MNVTAPNLLYKSFMWERVMNGDNLFISGQASSSFLGVTSSPFIILFLTLSEPYSSLRSRGLDMKCAHSP